ncbi:putative secondary metabolism biosynthetic enzyme [Microsporum audouinii]
MLLPPHHPRMGPSITDDDAVLQHHVENIIGSNHLVMPKPDIGPVAWENPGPAAYDFRSDFVTSPTMEMLQAITNCTLQDDTMEEDPTTNSFQKFMAHLTGHEASLNQVALRTALTAPPYSVLADSRSHIINMEAGGAATLCGAFLRGVMPANGHHFTLDDIKTHACLTTNIYDCPTKVISLENTLAGTIMPLSDTQAISQWARQQNPPIRMHLDGARLWEAVAADPALLKLYCMCFDTVTLCFTKGLGAPLGSIVVGSQSIITHACWMRKMLGGGLRQAGIIAAAARVSVTSTFLGRKLVDCHKVAREISEMWLSLGGKVKIPTETNMIWLGLDNIIDKNRFAELADKAGIKIMKGKAEVRIVVHYQICPDAVTCLFELFRQIIGGKQ